MRACILCIASLFTQDDLKRVRECVLTINSKKIVFDDVFALPLPISRALVESSMMRNLRDYIHCWLNSFNLRGQYVEEWRELRCMLTRGVRERGILRFSSIMSSEIHHS